MSNGFRILDASKLSYVEAIRKIGEATGGVAKANCLPLVVQEKKTVVYPTFQKHYKFALHTSIAPKDEMTTWKMIVVLLVDKYEVPAEFFHGGGTILKCGLCAFPSTEHEASIRLWCSKKIGNNIVYELTVSSYKDAIPEPFADKPYQTKKVYI
jgi:hypothetical protein